MRPLYTECGPKRSIATNSAKAEARKKLRDERREEHKEKVQAKVADLKGKLHHDRAAAG